MEFHHVGVATRDASEQAALLTSLFDAPVVHEEVFDGLNIVFIELPSGYIELLEPLKSGTVQRYLDRNGAGLHHFAVRTDDIDAALRAASDLGIDLVDEEPRPGAWGHRVAFLHPNSTGGILVEFVDR